MIILFLCYHKYLTNKFGVLNKTHQIYYCLWTHLLGADEVEEVDIEKDKEDEDEESLQPPKKRKK